METREGKVQTLTSERERIKTAATNVIGEEQIEPPARFLGSG